MKYLNIKLLPILLIFKSSFSASAQYPLHPGYNYGYEGQASSSASNAMTPSWNGQLYFTTPAHAAHTRPPLYYRPELFSSGRGKSGVFPTNRNRNAGSGSTSVAHGLVTSNEQPYLSPDRKKKDIFTDISSNLETKKRIDPCEAEKIQKTLALKKADIFSFEMLPDDVRHIGDIKSRIRNTNFVNLTGEALEPSYFVSYFSAPGDRYPKLGIVLTDANSKTECLFVALRSLLTILEYGVLNEKGRAKAKEYSIVNCTFQPEESSCYQNPEYREVYSVYRERDNTICLAENTIGPEQFRALYGKVNLGEDGFDYLNETSRKGKGEILNQIERALKRSNLAQDYSSSFLIKTFVYGTGPKITTGEREDRDTQMSLKIQGGKLYLGTKQQVDRVVRNQKES